jgi:hypothetical protein
MSAIDRTVVGTGDLGARRQRDGSLGVSAAGAG